MNWGKVHHINEALPASSGKYLIKIMIPGDWLECYFDGENWSWLNEEKFNQRIVKVWRMIYERKTNLHV